MRQRRLQADAAKPGGSATPADAAAHADSETPAESAQCREMAEERQKVLNVVGAPLAAPGRHNLEDV